ncbi:muscle M-line assembly protein unc-89-like [Ranitomeya imitator]|uniref:muscle M-line assembly protein unc-89-like n=1 Tax=Ranitomeya imitator TaxID=111125 RepID=UPI0037E84F60
MAPSTDHFLYDIYGEGSAASLMLILVNAVLVSATMVLACSFCKKSREVNFIKNQQERPKSELKKVIVHKDNWIQETNGIKNGVITTETELISEEKETEKKKMSSGLTNGKPSDSDQTSLDVMNRDLPSPPESTRAAAPAPEDPLYDSVRELQEPLTETRQNPAPSNEQNETNISKSNTMRALENLEPQNLDRINPLYESADTLKESSSTPETTPELQGHEVTKDEGRKVVPEPLYAVIRKDPSVKKPPPRDPGGEKRSPQDSAAQNVILQEKLNSDDEQRVDFIASMEQKSPDSRSSGDKVDSMLNNWKKRSIKSPKEAMTLNIIQEVPPLVPVKRFDIESEVDEYIIEEDTD